MYTYEELIESMTLRLSPEFDTREGTLAHIMMSAMAIGMARIYEELEIVKSNSQPTTACGEYLDNLAMLIGIERKAKCHAVVRIDGDSGLGVGDYVTNGEMRYKISHVFDGYYWAECTEKGPVGNEYMGEVLPVKDSIAANLAITSIVSEGFDKEDDESLRKRYMDRLSCPICTGNVGYYKEILNEIGGVGAAKVIPAKDEAGVVKIIIVNTDFEEASEELVSYVKEYLDPSEYEGLGYGRAPVGHRVVVESAKRTDITIDVSINGKTGEGMYKPYGKRFVYPALRKLNHEWGFNDRLCVKDRIVEDALYENTDVSDVSVLSVNGELNRCYLEENQIVGDLIFNGVRCV